MRYEPVAEGELAAVVTYLEMLERPTADIPQSTLRLEPIEEPSPDRYRQLFRLVGGPWLWFSRLAMDEAELSAIIRHPEVKLHSVIDEHDRDVGILELDFRQAGECELAFIGLVPELAGQGHGKWLLAEAIDRAWREGVSRVHVHTCSLDHPAALSAYRRAGFVPYARAIERFTDPRRNGVLAHDCAPQIPLI